MFLHVLSLGQLNALVCTCCYDILAASNSAEWKESLYVCVCVNNSYIFCSGNHVCVEVVV